MPNASTHGKGARGGPIAQGKGGGGGSGNGGAAGSTTARPGDWTCHICGLQANRAWRNKCRGCEADRNKSLQDAIAAAYKPTLAEKQTQQQRNAQRQQAKADADRRKLQAENERLAAELAAVKAQRTEVEGVEDADAEEMDDGDGFASWTEEERAKRLELAKGALAYAIDKHGDGSEEAAGYKDEIAALQRASRDAKPFKAHRDLLERRRERLRRQQERDE